jgi:hypothetical protein
MEILENKICYCVLNAEWQKDKDVQTHSPQPWHILGKHTQTQSDGG